MTDYCCDECAVGDNLAELRRVVERVESVYQAASARLAVDFAEPELVTDATSGRYILLDALVVVLEARLALARATT